MQKLNMLKINFKSSANENYLLNISINPFVPNAVFLYPTVFWQFQGVEKGCSGNERVKWKKYFGLDQSFLLSRATFFYKPKLLIIILCSTKLFII